MANLAIVHIDDDYEGLIGMVSFVATWLEDFWEEETGDYANSKIEQHAQYSSEDSSWIVYEITAKEYHAHTIRYIFIKDLTLPAEVRKYLFEESIFIVDVLRPVPGQPELGISVFESLRSIDQFANSSYSNVVLFTAFEGDAPASDGKQTPRTISKASDFGIEEFIGLNIERCLRNG